MKNSRYQKKWSRHLTLNEIVEKLEEDDEEEVPDSIIILPPENCNADVTDEDSGDENQVSLDNLPGSQLRALGEACFQSENCSDEDDDIPLMQLSRRRRVVSTESDLASQSTSTIESTGHIITVSKKKTYDWVSRDIRPSFEPWQYMQTTRTQFSPLQYFQLVFGEDIINMFVHYTNLYAAKKNANTHFHSKKKNMYLLISHLSLRNMMKTWGESIDPIKI
ncbi:piggyBac transposable element-derived protein 2-like [Spodoptera litura]|uniref:PiggyBac transposable element-derived protein 2-like n=1 Tax=Spodoptera litura TaxID=69820 RepID=A0A9J7ERZ8_SPOLT|nr:piggyBac transposable element-derived protein 2-like [Spodoptera litura]XP_022815294.1 piggyBac transposable element-derived protein 2-like [Spodoptera litura]XP_022818125.1 piggyBac transposable element-derived protein 2-like [Spodoptera litura]XP_022833708.1 piggyBac transposable element-derived protein 2-like [Spodoptera litura]XP_022834774.1 piggyBac transposable element-derived protein 2-like [Spodoptera litura]